MNDSTDHNNTFPQLHCAIVLHVREDACDVLGDGQLRSVRYARMFPSPRTERVSPGHLVATAPAHDGIETVIWRWYDAVVLGDERDLIRLWEPAHGEILAKPRAVYRPSPPGTRAYLSAGLPRAEWWVAGRATTAAENADVELDEVENLYTEHGLWGNLA